MSTFDEFVVATGEDGLVKYDHFEYLWPPRPEHKSTALRHYERKGYCLQYKKNGTCNVVAVGPRDAKRERQVVVMNRHNERHKAWDLTENSSRFFKKIPGDRWFVFVAELLNNKVSGGPKDTNYIFDLLVYDGIFLLGSTFEDRQKMLHELLLPLTTKKRPDELNSHIVLDDNTWLAKSHPPGSDFHRIFEEIDNPEDESMANRENEGVVLKNLKGKLQWCNRETANQGWQVKCRRQHKNFGF